MIKGPKAILSSSIATALDEFFEVDKDAIQSNLLGDAQIVLKDLKLRPRLTALPNSWANIEGRVTQAVFSWTWGPAGNWVQDATLTVRGLELVMTVTEENPEPPPKKKRPSLIENLEEAAHPHAAHPEEISSQGGIRGYIQEQVQKIIDSMKLRVEEYQLTIKLPRQQTSGAGEEGNSVEVEESVEDLTIEIRGEVLELISLGRLVPTNPDVSGTSLEQELNLDNFEIQIRSDDEILELVEKFSYKASTSRTSGQRFDHIMENLHIQGHGGDLSVHLGARQIKTLSYCAVLIMAPPGKEPTPPTTKPEEEKKDHSMVAPGNTPSRFDFDWGGLNLTTDSSTMSLPNAKLKYRADGTLLELESDGFNMKGSSDLRVKVSRGLKANLLTPMTLTFGSIDEITLPYTAKLVQPIANTKIVKEGQSYVMEFVDDVHIEMLKAKEEEAPPATVTAIVPTEQQGDTKTTENSFRANVVPYPMSVSMKHLVVTKEEDDNRTDFHNFYAFANPTPQGTEFALDVGKLQNYLLCLEDALVAGKLDQPHQINKFRLSAQALQVTAGHTPAEWAAAFERQGTAEQAEARLKRVLVEKKASSDSNSQQQPMKFPNCYVDPLKMTISWKKKGAVASVKDTKVTVQAFQGKANTTARELGQYYVASCLSHASDFIPNAELLGLNVVDSTMATFGNYLGMATLGPLGGVAAIGAVDSVKLAIAAGKKSRNQDDGAQTRPLDLFRGIAYTLQETGNELGKNPLNVAQDAVDTTGAYIEENKARLGGAGVGGAGMVLGGILGGPAGAIVAGVISQAVAEKMINTLDDDKKEPHRLEA